MPSCKLHDWPALVRLSLALCLCVAAVVGPGVAAAAPRQPAADVNPGAVLYHNYCSVCHGDKGDGKSRAAGSLSTMPRDLTSDASRRELTRERVQLAIEHGRPGTAMVGWKTQLGAADIARVTDYVMTRFVQADGAAGGRGREVYVANCSVCHGDKGQGGVWTQGNMARPPRNFAATDAQSLPREAMVTAVTHGRPGTTMAGFATRLNTSDIDAVVDYIRASLMAPVISGTRAHGGREADAASTSVTRVDMTPGLPNGLKGDPKRGGAFYLANCATCHGAKGDGAGPRAYFINPKPRNFLSDASRSTLNRVALYAAIAQGRLGTEMPAWDKVATPQQIADVAEHVFQTFIATGGGDSPSASARP